MKKIICLTLFLLAILRAPANASDIFYIKNINDTVFYNKNSWPDTSSSQAENIRNAINNLSQGDEAYIAAGEYNVTSTIELKAGVKLYGGFANDNSENRPEDRRFNGVTSLDAGGQCMVIKCEASGANNENTRLDGFVITGGKSANGCGMSNINGASPTIANCVFINNKLTASAARGGGIYNSSSCAKIINCAFIDNYAKDGAGIYNNNSNVTIINCTFMNNAAKSAGGAVHNKGNNNTLINCSFIENTALENGGGIYNYNASSIIKNCTFIGNSAGQNGGEIYNFYNDSTNTKLFTHDVINTVISHNNGKNGIYNTGRNNLNLKNCAVDALISGGNVLSADNLVLTGDGINYLSELSKIEGECGIVHTLLKLDKSDKYSKFINSGVSCDVNFDQSGEPRGRKPDIGSFEYQPLSAPDFLSGDLFESESDAMFSPDIFSGRSFDVALSDIADEWSITGEMPEWLEFEQLSPFKGRVKFIDTPAEGTFTIFMKMSNVRGLTERNFTLNIGYPPDSGGNDAAGEANNEADNENINDSAAQDDSADENEINNNEIEINNNDTDNDDENGRGDELNYDDVNEDKEDKADEINENDENNNEDENNDGKRNGLIEHDDYDDNNEIFGCGINLCSPTALFMMLYVLKFIKK